MLAKSKKGALVMAVVFEVSASIVSGAILAIRYLIAPSSLESGRDMLPAGSATGIVLVAAVLGLILVVGLSLGLISLLIYRGDDAHFGIRGAIRWALSGAIWAIIMQTAVMLLPDPNSADSAFIATLYQLCEVMVAGLALGLSYHLVFKWLLVLTVLW